MYECIDVEKRFNMGSDSITIFAGLNLKINERDFVSIMGPSGSGKTSLLNMLGGVDQPSAGRLLFKGEQINGKTENQLATWRAKHVGFVFQSYNLMPMLSVAHNVELPLLLHKMSATERKNRVAAALELVELYDRMRHLPGELSGGQQQRVAIARAIVSDPDVMLCDEPTGDLDRKTSDRILHLFSTLNGDFGKTIVLITHDPEAARYASVQLTLDKGEFKSSQTPAAHSS